MKKILLLLVLMVSMLAGCKAEEQTIVEETPIIEEPITFMDEASTVSGAENIVYIPNEHVSDSWYPNIYKIGDNLLIASYPEYYEGDEGQETSNVELKLISLRSGELINRVEWPLITGEIQVWGENVTISDPSNGTVTIFDKNLDVKKEYAVETNPMETWFMGTDLKTLYISEWDTGFFSYDLETGEKESLLEDVLCVYATKDANGNMFCHYTDASSQRNVAKCFSLETGEEKEIPLDYDIGYDCSRYEDDWIILSANDMSKYYLCRNGIQKEIPYEGNGIQLLNGKMLLVQEKSASLYEMDGTFVSGFELPDEQLNFVNNQFVWDSYWNGYFFVENRDGGSRLLFWDMGKESNGDNLVMEEPESREGEAISAELYKKARQISERFSVDILIADLCEEAYAEYTCSPELDEEVLNEALDNLESCMEMYPVGFFEQLIYGDHGPLQIALVTNIQRDDEVGPSAAFVWGHIMVIDSLSVAEHIFYHEVSHVIDQKLDFDAGLNEEASYSEEIWLSLQPDGFDYAYSYVDSYLLEVDYDCFVSSYSATFPTEDRAELMDYAMRDVVEFEEGTILYDKLEYYSNCIRECFDTVDWPPITMWEEPLYQ